MRPWLVLIAVSACGRLGFDDGPMLAARYSFETPATAIVADDSGNGLDAQCMGSSCPASATGRVGNGYLFDGSDDYLLVSDDGRLDFTSGFTVALWVQLAEITNCQSAISKPKITGEGASFELALQSADTLYCTVDGDSVEHCIMLGTPATAGVWTHYAMTWDGTWKRFYIAGTEVASAPGTTTFDEQPLLIGSDRENGAFNCQTRAVIDEVELYRGALAANAVAALANP